MRRVAAATALVFLLRISLFAADEYPGPKCLGPFCLDRNDSGKSVFAQVGRPLRKATLYCYTPRKGKGFLRVEISQIENHRQPIDNVFLSDFPNCAHMPEKVNQTTNDDLNEWKTPESIGLGSSETAVIRAYGKPNFVHQVNSSRFHSLVLGYRRGDIAPDGGQRSIEYRLEDRTRSAEFGIRNGKVAWIELFR